MKPTPNVSLVLMTPACLDALLDNDLGAAGAEIGLMLPPFFLQEAWLWRIRRDQLAADPARRAGWCTR